MTVITSLIYCMTRARAQFREKCVKQLCLVVTQGINSEPTGSEICAEFEACGYKVCVGCDSRCGLWSYTRKVTT